MNSEDTNMLVARQTPTGRGMTFVRFEMIKLDDIDVGIGRNTGRGGKGMVSPKIEDFIRIMLNGNYSPEYYIPPVIECSAINEFTISLKAGFHRVIGAKRIWEQVKSGQREEDPNIPATMGMIEVAVVDFDDDVARDLYANLENIENENEIFNYFLTYEIVNQDWFDERLKYTNTELLSELINKLNKIK